MNEATPTHLESADPGPGSPRRRRRWLRRTLWLLALSALAVITLVALLPRLVSSDWLRQRATAAVSERLGRPLTIGDLELTWAGTFTVRDLALADAPPFGKEPLLQLGSLEVWVDPSALLHRDLDLVLNLRDLQLRGVREADGTTNLATLLADAGLARTEPAAAEPFESEPERPTPSGPLRLPLSSLSVALRLDKLALDWDDRATGHRARVREAHVHLDAGSDGSPVTFSAQAALNVDDHNLPPVQLAAELHDLFGPGSEVHPERARVSVDGRLPGIELRGSAQPGPEGPTARAEVGVDLQALLAAARPFLPPDLANLEFAGHLALEASIADDPQQAAAFDVMLNGSGLSARGGPLGPRAIGPLEVTTRHHGSFRRSTGKLAVDAGDIGLGTHGNISWSAMVGLPGEDFGANSGSVDATIDSLHLDLDALLALATPLLPPDLEAALAVDGSRLDLRGLRFAGPLNLAAEPPTTHRVTLERLGLGWKNLRYRPAGAGAVGATVKGLGVELTGFTADLSGSFPAQATGVFALSAVGVDLTGASPVQITGLDLPDLHFAARNLRPEASAPGGVMGNFAILERLAVAELVLPDLANLARLDQSIKIDAATHPGGRIEARLRELQVSVGEAGATAGGGTWGLHSGTDGETGMRLQMGSLDLDGAPAAGDLILALRDLNLTLARVAGTQQDTRASIAGLQLGLPAVAATLVQQHPRRVSAGLDLSVAQIGVEGPQPVSLVGLRLRLPELTAADLGPDTHRAFGWAGSAKIRQELTLDELRVPGRAILTHLDEGLTLTADLGDPAARLRVPKFVLSTVLDVADPPLSRPVSLEVQLQTPTLTLRGPAPADVDVEEFGLRAALGDILAVHLGASARAGGAQEVAANGALSIDLDAMGRLLPPESLRQAKLAGKVAAEWQLKGRVPAGEELRVLREDPASLLSRAERLPFLAAAGLKVRLEGVGVELPSDSGRIAVGGVFTKPELRVTIGPRGKTMNSAGGLDLRWIEELPGLARLTEPWSAHLGWEAALASDATVTLQESFSLEPVGVTQRLDLHLGGLERVAAADGSAPLFRVMHGVDADLKLAAAIAENPTLTALATDTQIKGPLHAGADLRLRAGREVAGAAWLSAQDAAVVLPGLAQVEGLDAAVKLARRLVVIRTTGASPAAPKNEPHLSRVVLDLPSPGTPTSTGLDPADASATSPSSYVALRRVRVEAGPVPLEMSHAEVRFSLPGGLPDLERFQADLLGGTVRGGVTLAEAESAGTYRMQGSIGFTGLDTARLAPQVPPAPPGSPAEDSEISGQVAFLVPLVPDLSALVDGIGFEGGLTHVGSRTLDRALFALDPTESNESIVQQRRMVRLGSPRWFRATLRDGNLATAGEVQAVGITLNLPRIERFPLSRLPLLTGLARWEPQLRQLVETLDLASADRVAVTRDGELQFLRGEAP